MFAKSGSETNVRQPAAREALARPAFAAGARGGSLFDPLQVLAEIWSLKWLVVLLTLLGIAAGVLLALSTPHRYTAVAEILVDPRDIKLVQNEVTPNGLPSDATLGLIESQISVIYSNDVLQRVIDKAGLADDPEFNGKTKSLLDPLFALFAGKEDAQSARRRQLMTLAALRDGGTAVLYGGYDATRGGKARPAAMIGMLLADRLSALRLFSRSQGVVGYNVTSWRDARPEPYRRDLAAVLELIGSGAIQPKIAKVLPLAEAAEAQALLQSAQLAGKIVLRP